MWVRLRMLVVPSVEEDEENRADDGQLEATPTTPISEDGFDDGKLVLPDEKNELDVRVIVKAMAEHPLDRQRLDMWRNWFVDSAEKGKKNTTKATKEDVMVQLKRVLDDEDNVSVDIRIVSIRTLMEVPRPRSVKSCPQSRITPQEGRC